MVVKTKKVTKTKKPVSVNQVFGKTKKIGLINYSVGDFLARIKNSCIAKKHTFEVRNTKFVRELANTLKKEGYLDDVRSEGEKLIVKISYRKKDPLIIDIKLVSKPGIRIYMKADELEKYKEPYNIIVSTNKGTMSAREAVKKRLGGEVIAKIL